MFTYVPTQLLRSYIKTYILIENQDELVNRVLPDTALVMAFIYKGKVSHLESAIKKDLPSFAVSGLRKSARLLNYSKNTGNILVIFKEAAANAFFKEPLHELFEDSVPLDNFAGYRNLSLLQEQLAEAPNNVQRINLIERFLLSKLINQNPDKLILNALEKIHLSQGTIRIKELSNNLFISQDAFEKRFRRIVGVSPKQFSVIARMRNVIRKGKENLTLTNLAYDSGYFDQSHFIRDFELFTGQTPSNFFKSSSFW